jgi:hypothetical protein
MHTPFVGAYWASRKEAKEKCAQRVVDFFERIRENSALAEWFPKGRSAKTTKSPVPSNAKGILPFLKTNNRDTNGSAIAELGFSLNLWNGSSSSLSITCGAFSPAIRNSVVVSLPPLAEIKSGDLENMRLVFEATIDVWDPDQAVVTSSQLMSQKGGGMPWQTKGWFNYSKE